MNRRDDIVYVCMGILRKNAKRVYVRERKKSESACECVCV